MSVPEGFAEISDPPRSTSLLTAAQVQSGPWLDPIARIITYSADDWEKFVDEWISSLKTKYASVLRASGGGDKGIDVAGFTDEKLLNGIWDNYQCKHFSAPVSPSAAYVEMGKILWYSFNNIYVPPRAYYFVAPKEVSTSLALLLANSDRLKAGLKHAWNKGVQDKIASKPIPLEGTFQTYVENFDFSIFHSQSLRELVDEHRHTPYFVPRFGGGLPARPRPAGPPAAITERESVYVGRLLEAYADHTKAPISAITDLRPWTTLEDHFRRSREAFYHAESLRVFVRDKVEPGTFESLQDEIYDGVVDTRNATHSDGYECVVEVTKVAQSMSLDAHPLVASVFPTDRRGICHQLANEERLKWIK